MENNLILYGASGHCKVVIDTILSTSKYHIKNIIDDDSSKKTIFDYEVLSADKLVSDSNYFISIGNNGIRRKLASKIKGTFVKLIHNDAKISKLDVEIGLGTLIMAGAVINPSVTIGNHCIVNTAAIVEHDCKIADYVHICPGVKLAGGIIIEEGAMIGLGSSIIQGVKIGKWVTIGAGSVIISDVPDYAVVVGNPGRIIKFNKNEG